MIKFKEMSLDSDAKSFFIEDKSVSLTKNEFNLMNKFMSNVNKIFSRAELISDIWKTPPMSEKAVDVTISRLRKKLNPFESYIVAKSGFGYGITDN